MKPRRWVGYWIALNDLLPDAQEILDRFERSEIPLDDTFGSSSDPARPLGSRSMKPAAGLPRGVDITPIPRRARTQLESPMPSVPRRRCERRPHFSTSRSR
jgi:hypothetical protein